MQKTLYNVNVHKNVQLQTKPAEGSELPLYKIAVCDDVKSDYDVISRMISDYFKAGTNYCLHYFPDSSSLLRKHNVFMFDIIFIDIMLVGETGIELAREINRISPLTRIIYQSSNPDFATELYSTEHTYFLQKPIKPADFTRAVDKALKTLKDDFILVGDIAKTRIKLSEIVYISTADHSLYFILSNSTIVEARKNLAQIERNLSGDFLRCHKSYVVNLKYVKGYLKGKYFLISPGNVKIPIGRKYINECDEYITAYFGEKIL